MNTITESSDQRTLTTDQNDGSFSLVVNSLDNPSEIFRSIHATDKSNTIDLKEYVERESKRRNNSNGNSNINVMTLNKDDDDYLAIKERYTPFKRYEAILYKEPKGRHEKVECRACAFKCKLGSGQVGLCTARQAYGSRLYLMTFGRLSNMVIYSSMRALGFTNYHPNEAVLAIGTIGCNLNCNACQYKTCSQVKLRNRPSKAYSSEEIEDFYVKSASTQYFFSPEEIVEECKNRDIKFIAATFNEFTIWFEYFREIAIQAKKEGIKCIACTNGLMSEEVVEFITTTNLIDALNISLKFNHMDSYTALCYKREYKEMITETKGQLVNPITTILNNIRLLSDAGIHIEVTTLLINKINESNPVTYEIASLISDISKKITFNLDRFIPTQPLLDLQLSYGIDIFLTAMSKIKELSGLKNINCSFDFHKCLSYEDIINLKKDARKDCGIDATIDNPKFGMLNYECRCENCGHLLITKYDPEEVIRNAETWHEQEQVYNSTFSYRDSKRPAILEGYMFVESCPDNQCPSCKYNLSEMGLQL